MTREEFFRNRYRSSSIPSVLSGVSSMERSNENPLTLPISDPSLMGTVVRVNPETGLLVDQLYMYFKDPEHAPTDFLSTVASSPNIDLSDTEKLALLNSRTAQSYAEKDAYRNALGKIFDYVISSSRKDKDDDTNDGKIDDNKSTPSDGMGENGSSPNGVASAT